MKVLNIDEVTRVLEDIICRFRSGDPVDGFIQFETADNQILFSGAYTAGPDADITCVVI